ncbi:MAG: hypothetical protein HOB78_08585 [Flavobacteriales bacterium]|jgi:hypothetical protein|nr:hypothetical protein [Flavobacteriales bacterium]
MTKGISVTSAIITISGSTAETVAGVMEEEQVPLSLDILNREVLLVYAVDINCSEPEALAGINTFTEASISSTSRTTLGHISDTNVLAAASKAIRAGGFVDGGVGFQDVSPETPTSNALDYIGIISTNDFFVQVKGFQNVGVMQANWRVWAARARVTADIYAALVQGEALSA